MKYILFFVLFTGTFFCLKYSLQNPKGDSFINSKKLGTQWFFDVDSGYVTKDQILPFLQINKLTDTVQEESYTSTWSFVKSTDTIGDWITSDAGCLKKVLIIF